MLWWPLRSTSLCFQCCSSEALYHEKVLPLISWSVATSEMCWSFALPVLVYCSAVWCSVSDSYLKLLNRLINSAVFLAGGVLECNHAHRRSVAVLCMLSKIMSNPMHPLSCSLPLSYVPTRVTHFALVDHRHSFAPPRCRTHYRSRTFVPLSVSIWNDLGGPVFDGVWLAGFKSRANAFRLA